MEIRNWTPAEHDAYIADLVASWSAPPPEVMAEVNRILGPIPVTDNSVEVEAAA